MGTELLDSWYDGISGIPTSCFKRRTQIVLHTRSTRVICKMHLRFDVLRSELSLGHTVEMHCCCFRRFLRRSPPASYVPFSGSQLAASVAFCVLVLPKCSLSGAIIPPPVRVRFFS